MGKSKRGKMGQVVEAVGSLFNVKTQAGFTSTSERAGSVAQVPQVPVRETSVDDASSAHALNPKNPNTCEEIINDFHKVCELFPGETNELLGNYKATFSLAFIEVQDKSQDLIKGFSDLLKAYREMNCLDDGSKAKAIVAAHNALSKFLTEKGIAYNFSAIDRIFRTDEQIKAEADRLAKEEADRLAKEEADRAAKEEADRLAKAEAERLAKAEAERKAKEEADRKAKEEADRLAKEEADRLAKEEADRKAKEEADRKAKEEADRKAKEEADRKVVEIGKFAQSFILKLEQEAIKEAAKAEVTKKAKILADKESAKIANDQLEGFSSLFKSPLQKLKDNLDLLIGEKEAAQGELEEKLRNLETANEELMKASNEVSVASLELKKLRLKDTRGESLTNRKAETYKQKDYSVLDNEISEKEGKLKNKIKNAEIKEKEAAEAKQAFDEALVAFNQKSQEERGQVAIIQGHEATFSDSIAALKKAFSNYVKEMMEAQEAYDTHILAAKNSSLAELVKLTKSKFTSDLKEGVAKILAIQGANEGVVVQVSSPVNGRLLNLNTSISDLLSKTCEFVDSTMYEHNKSLAQPKKSQNKDVMKKAFEALKGALAEDLELQGYKAGLKAAKYSDEKIGKLEVKLQEVWSKFKAFASDKEKAIEDLFSGFDGYISSEAESYKACATEATKKLESDIAHHNIIAEFMGENYFHLGGMINGTEPIDLKAGLSREGMVEGAIAHKECLGEDLASLF